MKILSGIVLISLTMISCTVDTPQNKLYEIDLFGNGDHGVANYRIPSLVTTNKGTVLAVCDARVDRPGDLPNNIDLVIRRSNDNGQTWSDQETIVDYPGQEGGGDPCMVVDKITGKVWLFYVYGAEGIGINYSKQGLAADSTQQLYAMTSSDEGLTWTPPRNLTPEIKDPAWYGVFFASGRGIQSSDGSLLVPLMVRKSFGTASNDHAHVAISNDHGKTWRVGESAGILMGESKLTELSDGKIMINMRSKHKLGQRAINLSADRGETWGDFFHDHQLVEPACNASILNYPAKGNSGDLLLFSNPASNNKREKMSVRKSSDEGQTWSEPVLVYEGPSAYSSMTVLADGTIGLLYERGTQNASEKITFAKFPLEWLDNELEQMAQLK